MRIKAEKESEHIPGLYSISVAVRPLQAGVLPLAHGYHVYSLFLNIVRASNPLLAEKLHAGDAVKPFTTSILTGKMRRRGAQLAISPDAPLFLRLTFLDSAVFSHFMDGAIRWGERPVEIAGLSFRVEEVETIPRKDSPAAFQSYQGILDDADTSGQIDMEFLTPTVFRSGGRRNNIFPEPALVFGSYWNKWQTLSSVKMDDNLSSYFEKITVTRYRLQTGIWNFGSYQEVGYAGSCRFEIDPSVTDDKVVYINALADFALFCGTGAKTTMGMGQTWRVDHAGSVSGGTRSHPQEER
ncbi:CRISPR-associated endoribonuclease Cas6 [Chloroflexota bacterium]